MEMKISARRELDNINSMFNLKGFFSMTAISSLILLLQLTVVPCILESQPLMIAGINDVFIVFLELYSEEKYF